MLAVYGVASSLVIADVYGQTNCTYSRRHVYTLSCEDTIPLNVSKDTKTVILTGFSTDMVLSNLTFQETWENITSLFIFSNNIQPVVFRTRCFTRLNNLKRLTINVNNPVFEKRVFHGLTSLERLTLFNIHLFSEEALFYSLNSSDFKQLRYLRLFRNKNTSSSGLELGDLFWKFIGAVLLKSLDISGMHVASFNLTSFNANCKRLNYLTMYDTRFTNVHMTVNDPSVQSCRKPRVLSSSTTIVEKIKIWCPGYKTYFKYGVDLGLTESPLFSGVNVVTIENMCSANFNSLSITNFNFKSGPKLTFKWNITRLFLTANIFKGPCKGSIIASSTLLLLSLSNNGISYLCPDAISSIATLRYLHLSSNNLNAMNMMHKSTFERLFFTLRNMEIISLESNLLTRIPENIFLKNENLKKIDLSNNRISKVTFKIDHLKNLVELNVRKNIIFTLDGSAMTQLDNILNTQIDDFVSNKLVFNILDNRLECSSCESYIFIHWLQQKREIWTNSVKCCLNENKTLEYLFDKTFHDDCVIKVDEDEDEERDINTSVVVALFLLMPTVMIISAKILRTYLDKRKRKCVKEEFVKKLQIENKEHEYLLFLAFSSEDDSFINEEVVPSLTPRLLTLVHDVKPLCIGDTAFRLGKYIHDEIITCLEKSKVVFVLLTNNYCRSR